MKVIRTNITKCKVRDDYNTPIDAWQDILKFIPLNTKIWQPFYNDGSCEKILNDLGYNNIYHKNKDFFKYWLDDYIIIDNPPFSIKNKIIERCIKKSKPFALLLPFDTIARKYFKNYNKNVQILIPEKRYKFNNLKNPPFKSVWICWNFNKYLKSNEKLIYL